MSCNVENKAKVIVPVATEKKSLCMESESEEPSKPHNKKKTSKAKKIKDKAVEEVSYGNDDTNNEHMDVHDVAVPEEAIQEHASVLGKRKSADGPLPELPYDDANEGENNKPADIATTLGEVTKQHKVVIPEIVKKAAIATGHHKADSKKQKRPLFSSNLNFDNALNVSR